MKFVMTQPLAPAGMEMLEKLGIEWTVGPGADWDAYPDEVLESADAVLIRLEKCPESFIARCKNLKVLGRPGMGFENVPVDYCTRRGIPVVLAPGANARSVAEHALALIFACAKDLVEMDGENRKGNWQVRAHGRQMELCGKKVGILGVGGIGSLLAGMCTALGMECLGYSHSHNRARVEAAGCRYVDSLEEILKESDFVSLHMPLLPETYHCIGARELGLMKQSAFLINTARGAVVDEQALADAVNQGVIAGAGVDVYSTEPARRDNPVFTAPGIICTPHSAALTPESWARMSCGAVEGCYAVCRGEKWQGVANPEVYETL